MSYTPPPLLTGAREKLIAAPAFADLVDAGTVGSDDMFVGGWVFYGTKANGLPLHYGEGAAVTLHLRGSWNAPSRFNNLTFPRLQFSVWASGDPDTDSGEWQAREVGAVIVSEFHDPANAHDHQWSAETFAVSCLWDGSETAAPVRNIGGLYRVDLSFELEIG